jgi:hypothetical protein
VGLGPAARGSWAVWMRGRHGRVRSRVRAQEREMAGLPSAWPSRSFLFFFLISFSLVLFSSFSFRSLIV